MDIKGFSMRVPPEWEMVNFLTSQSSGFLKESSLNEKDRIFRLGLNKIRKVLPEKCLGYPSSDILLGRAPRFSLRHHALACLMHTI